MPTWCLWRCLLLAALSCAVLSAGTHKRRSRERTAGTAAPGDFDYYLLSMSWAPDFCAQPDVPKNDRECGAGRHVGFVVHGLWPQAEAGRSPQQCAPARPVAQDVVNRMLAYIPSEGLIQHEWKNHGTCSGLTSAQYFDSVRKAFESVKIPADYKELGRSIEAGSQEIENKFAAANPSFPRAAFRVSCRSNELQEVRVCFSKDLRPRSCTDSAGECRVPEITMRRVQ
jgi:ribonuclease T2